MPLRPALAPLLAALALLPAAASAATVSGVVRLEGEPPKLLPYIVTRDERTCGKQVENESILVHDGLLKNAVVALEGAKGPVSPGKAMLDQKGCQYVPHVLAVPVGTELALNNGDQIAHNVHLKRGNDDALSWPLPITNRPRRKVLSTPGLLTASCDMGHSWMQAYVHVFDHPYFAVTGDDGAFRLENVPDGSYTLVVWHETLGQQRIPVTVKGGALEQNVLFKK